MKPEEIAIKLALKKLFSDSFFSICQVDSCLSLTNSIPDEKTYKILRAIHCVPYNTMPADFREWLFNTVIKMFSCNGFKIQDIDIMSPFFSQQMVFKLPEPTT